MDTHPATEIVSNSVSLSGQHSAKALVNEAALALFSCSNEAVGDVAKRQIAATLKRMNLGLFRLVVMGEQKKGKSSFVNSLIAEYDLLPTSSDVATSTVFKLMYGPSHRFKVFFLPDEETGEAGPPKSVSKEVLREYGTEAGNPGNEKRVDFIGIECPSPLLKTGIVLVDTPGVGGLFKAHRDISWRFAPNADAIVFVVDSVATVINADEVSFVKEVTQQFKKPIVFVQTKTDSVGEAQWQGWADRNKEVLAKELRLSEQKIAYFPLSAHEKRRADESKDLEDLADSGFVPLLTFINRQLIPAKEEILASVAARQLIEIADIVARDADDQINLSSGTVRERLSTIEHTRRESFDAFQKWQREEHAPQVNRSAAKLAELKVRTRDAIEDHLNPSGHLILDFMQSLTNGQESAEELSARASLIQQDFLAQVGGKINNELAEYCDQFQEIAKSLPYLPQNVTLDDVEQISHSNHRMPSTISQTTDGFSMLQNSVMGMGVGMSAAYIAVSVATVAFPPAAGLFFIAQAAAGIGGLIKGYEQHAKRAKNQALGAVNKLLSDTLNQIRRQTLREFDRRAEGCSQKFTELTQGALDDMRQQLERKLDEAKAAQQRTHEEAKLACNKAESTKKFVGEVKLKLRERFEGKRNA